MPKEKLIFYVSVSAETDTLLAKLVEWVTRQVTAILNEAKRKDACVAIYDGDGVRQTTIINGSATEVPPAAIPIKWDQPSPFEVR